MKSGGVVAGAVVVLAVMVLATPVVAGDLNPPGPPGPTMKTLDQIPPTWSQTLQCNASACPRFQLVLGGAGVLDKETGLVWERSPSTTTRSWDSAMSSCQDKIVGNRKGWRLPTVEQLGSLVDPSVSYPGPTLPSGHPFIFAGEPVGYWTASTMTNYSAGAFYVAFYNGLVGSHDKSATDYVWCVRGGQTYDGR